MALTLQAAPKSDVETLVKALDNIRFIDRMAGGAEAYDVSEPVPVYGIDLETAARNGELSFARQVGWRYLLSERDTFAIADIESDPDDVTERFNSLTRGRVADAFAKALEVAETTATASAETYDLRALELPSINMGAIWLFRAGKSIFVPYLDSARLQGSVPRQDNGFLSELRRRAAVRISESRAAESVRPIGSESAKGAN
jgi:hypothetical protein